MPKLDDKGTDKLFQAGAERHDFAYNPAAWELMEGKLDADLRRRRMWQILGGLLLLVALTAGAWWTLGNNDVADLPAGAVIAATDQEANDVNNTIENATSVANTNGDSLNEEQATIADNAAETFNDVTIAAGTNGSVVSDDAIMPPSEQAGISGESTVFENSNIDANNLSATAEASVIQNVTPRSEKAVKGLKADELTEVASINTPNTTIGKDARLSASTGLSPKTANSVAVSVGGGFIYGMLTNSMETSAQPRFNLGLEYRMGKRFALATGVAFNKIKYASSGDDYFPKGERWVRGIKPTTVDAHCQVLEVPLSATYYFSGSRNSGFYGSAGAINYLMLTEKYEFTYAEEAEDLKKAWTGKNSNNHFFGVGHVNLGYQFALRGRSALRLETYVHLPFTGIGQGQMNLMSAGVTANYSFDFRRK